MRLDHVSYVTSHDQLADTVQRLGARLGSTFVDGGVHPRFGTRNFTMPLQNGQYIEVVCPLDHPATEQTPWGKAVSKKAQEGGGWLTWVFATEDISKVEEKFGRSAIEGHRTRPDGSDLKWKQIGVNEITDSRELPFFIQWLTADHPSQDGKAVAAIEKITIADTDHLADSWFKSEILGGLNGADVEFVDPSTNDGEYGIVAVHLTTPSGSVVLINPPQRLTIQIPDVEQNLSYTHPMSYTAGQYTLLGLAAFAMSGLLTWPIRKLAIAIGAMDRPNMERKTQKEPVPYLGGVAIALTILIITYASIAANQPTAEKFTLASQALIPASILGLMGLVDDLKGLEALPRLMLQTLAAIIMSLILTNTNTIGYAFGNTTADTIVSIVWIVGICNAINFFDNLDGGAAGTVAAATVGIFLIAFAQGQELISALAILTTGATLGFLIWNKSPAKIYMGDAGALFLGIIVSSLTIRMDPGLDPNWKSLAIPVILLGVPILDTTVAVTSRIQRSLTPFNGGKDHLSHRLVRIGLTHRNAAFSLWGASCFCATLAYTIYRYPNEFGTGLILGCAILWLGALFIFLKIPSEDLEPFGQSTKETGL